MATTATTSTALAEHLRVTIGRTQRRLRQEAGNDFGPSLVAALATIERHGPLTPGEVAQREGVRRPTATRLVARLEELGLVVRSEDPSDGRSCLLAATAQGRATLVEQRERKGAFLAARLARLTAEERRVLVRAAALLDRLLEEPREEATP